MFCHFCPASIFVSAVYNFIPSQTKKPEKSLEKIAGSIIPNVTIINNKLAILTSLQPLIALFLDIRVEKSDCDAKTRIKNQSPRKCGPCNYVKR